MSVTPLRSFSVRSDVHSLSMLTCSFRSSTLYILYVYGIILPVQMQIPLHSLEGLL